MNADFERMYSAAYRPASELSHGSFGGIAQHVESIPIATFELKNSLTKQTVADAEEQYKRDRDPRERLFELPNDHPQRRN
jgi:hypothetical protein